MDGAPNAVRIQAGAALRYEEAARAGMRERGHERGDIADAGAERSGQQLTCGGGLRQGFLCDDLARGAEDALAQHHTKRTEDDDLRIERVDEEREAAAHPFACDSGDGESVGIIAKHGFNERADG